MYGFHYNYMMNNFEGCKLLFTDTDSIFYSIPDVKDVSATMKDIEWFNSTNFTGGHSNYSERIRGSLKNSGMNVQPIKS